jgi:4-amino-4-deoxy-L-arabinose transferase-like glycosyltransferase
VIRFDSPRSSPVVMPERRTLALGALALLVLWFGLLGLRGLFSPDEGRYALIPHEMLASGDWITPHLNGLVYFEKPPLQYWATAGFFRVLGEGAFTARLWPALCGLGTLVIVGLFARSRGGPLAGLAAVCVLSGSFLFALFGQVATLDMGLAFFLTLALASLMQAEAARTGSRPARARRWLLLGWLSLAAAFLTKGLIAFVLPSLALGVYLLIRRDWRLPLRLALLPGLALVALICAPWMIAAQNAHGEFLEFFIIHEHFARFGSGVHHRTGAWWYFLLVLAVGMLPWTAFWRGPAGGRAPVSIRTWAADGGPAFDERLFMRVWVVLVVLFFSVSQSKLPGYVLPVLPWMAVQTGLSLASSEPTRLAGRCLPGAAFALILVVIGLGGAVSGFDDVPASLARAFVPWVVVSAGVLGVAALTARGLFLRSRPAAAVMVLGLVSLAGWQVLLAGTSVFEASYSARAFAAEVDRSLAPGERDDIWYSVGTFDNSFAFYSGRELVLVAYRDELDLGLTIDPDRGIDTLDEFVERWVASDQAGAMMQPRTYEALLARGLPMALVARDERRVFVLRQRVVTSLL